MLLLLLAGLAGGALGQGQLLWMDSMTSAKRAILLNEHNRLRALEPASNMQKMVWDSNLEALAAARVGRCNAAHSTSGFRSNKYGFKYIGENIWWSTETRLRGNLDSIIMEFYKEKPFFDFRTTGCQRGQMCGHYTQVVWHDTCAVGCAISRCGSIANGAFIRAGHVLVCHYGKGGNYRGQQPYRVGRRCSGCAGGCTSDGFCQPTCGGQAPVALPSSFAASRAQTPATTHAAALKGGNSASCATTSAMCDGWALIGECERNRCEDESANCAAWARRGECTSSKNYMDWRCRRSCGVC